MVSRKSISLLQKEIKGIEKRKKEDSKRKELEERLERLKAPSRPKRIGARERVRMGFGKRVSGALDRASGLRFS